MNSCVGSMLGSSEATTSQAYAWCDCGMGYLTARYTCEQIANDQVPYSDLRVGMCQACAHTLGGTAADCT